MAVHVIRTGLIIRRHLSSLLTWLDPRGMTSVFSFKKLRIIGNPLAFRGISHVKPYTMPSRNNRNRRRRVNELDVNHL